MLEPHLLDRARQLAGQVLDAQREVDRASADYHYALRQLHLNGATLREIGAALGLSHQRVGQIVSAGSRSWLQRLRDLGASESCLECSFCGLSSAVVDKLVAGPQVHICDRCLRSARSVLDGGVQAAGGALTTLLERSTGLRCSFCGKKSSGLRCLVASGDRPVRICSECLPMAENCAFGDDSA